MKTSSLKFVLLLGTLALAACRPDPLGPTGVQIDLVTQDPRLYATSFQLVWMDQASQLFEKRVPETGLIDEMQAPAVSVYISLTSDKVGMRRVLVRGLRDEKLISEGAARFYASDGVWSEIGVPMVALGTLPDSDGDGLPDSVDNCPRERDPCGSTTTPPDAGAEPDAEAPDAAPATPDLGPNLDVPPVLPTSLDAGGNDVRPS
jgi:hypothetical protein